MTIEHPWALLIIALALLPWLRRRSGAIFQFSSFYALKKSRLSQWFALVRRIALSAIVVMLAAALAGFSLPKFVHDMLDEGAFIVLVRDLSGSMYTIFDAETKKDKVTVATEIEQKFVRLRPHDHYGLIDFGNQAVTRMRLTADKKRVAEMLALPPLSLGGTVIDQALARAISLFPEERSIASKAIILVSDGDGRMDTLDDLARWMKEGGIHFWWVFIGSVIEWESARGVRSLTERLGAQAGIFRADTPADLERVMMRIRELQRGVIRMPQEIRQYSLSSFFYWGAFGFFCVSAVFIWGECRIASAASRREIS